MPTPSSGQISMLNITNEFGILGGQPTALGEYCGRAGSDPSLTFGIEGVSTTGQVAFSDLYNRTAHASAKKILSVIRASFGGSSVLRSITSCDGSTSNRYPLLFFNPAVYNATCGGAGNGNLTAEDTAVYLTNINQISDAGVSEEDVKVSRGATIIFLGVGQATPSTLGGYYTGDRIRLGTATGSLPTNVAGYYRLASGATTNITNSMLTVNDDPGIDHGVGTASGRSYYNATCKTATTIFNLPMTNSFSQLLEAGWDRRGPDWNGNNGSSQSDTMNSGITFVIPGRWQRISSTLHATSGGTMTLGPYEIAIVTNAISTSTSPTPPYTVSQTSGTAASSITPIWATWMNFGCYISCSIYMNETSGTGTYNIAATGYRPLVQIFRFQGDGYCSSVLENI